MIVITNIKQLTTIQIVLILCSTYTLWVRMPNQRVSSTFADSLDDNMLYMGYALVLVILLFFYIFGVFYTALIGVTFAIILGFVHGLLERQTSTAHGEVRQNAPSQRESERTSDKPRGAQRIRPIARVAPCPRQMTGDTYLSPLRLPHSASTTQLLSFSSGRSRYRQNRRQHMT